MSNQQHTPGPWYAEGHKVFKDVGDFAHMVATCENWSEETTANARLIAAAPDLLRAAVAALTIVNRDNPDGSIANDLRAAIAKAEGRS